ncbi:MAG: hypothetical protein LKF31_04695 [Muribaculaceae bacterium]|jgi:hypothetical protein|nr:hypothetical protein [Muribaculaceae bacterium]
MKFIVEQKEAINRKHQHSNYFYNAKDTNGINHVDELIFTKNSRIYKNYIRKDLLKNPSNKSFIINIREAKICLCLINFKIEDCQAVGESIFWNSVKLIQYNPNEYMKNDNNRFRWDEDDDDNDKEEEDNNNKDNNNEDDKDDENGKGDFSIFNDVANNIKKTFKETGNGLIEGFSFGLLGKKNKKN